MSEISGQGQHKYKVESQILEWLMRSAARRQKRMRILNHATYHLADFFTHNSEILMLLHADVVAALGKAQTGVRLAVLSVAILSLLMSALRIFACPCFS